MPKFEMPKEDSEQPSEYAGKEPEYNIRSVMETTEGKRVLILNYLKDKSLYVVMNLDEEEVRSPAYRISPDRLRKIEDNNEEKE